MKVKIRKVEVTMAQFVDALENAILVHEIIPRRRDYLGTPLEYVCKNLGIKEFDFWDIYSSNAKLFRNRVEAKQLDHSDIHVLYRTEKLKEIERKEAALTGDE